MYWDDWDVGEVDLAARNQVLSSDELSEIERRYWETEWPRAVKAARNRWERIALSLLDGRVHPLDPPCAATVSVSRSTRSSCATPRGSPAA